MKAKDSTVIHLPAPGSSPGTPIRILVVEDEESTRGVVMKILKRTGYEVDGAANGCEACACIDAAAYALVLTDVCMPGSISGMDVLAYAKRKSPHTEVILMTGYPGVHDAVQSVKSGAFNYVSKPVCAELLRNEVEAALAAQRQKDIEKGAAAVDLPVGGYRVLRSLGSSLFATVLLVEKDDRRYAMKVFRAPGEDPLYDKALQRFLREGEIISSLNLDGVVHVFEIGRGSPGTGPFIIMEYVEGDGLNVLMTQGALSLLDKLDILSQIAATLDSVHARQIVHRDIKPSNILVAPGNRVKICDFGTARLGPSRLTLSKEVVGTPAYMAPELFSTGVREAGAAADLFSLGVLGYELLTGRLPFIADSFEGMIHEILTAQPPAPRSVNPAIPPAVEEILAVLLAKAPGYRYRTAGEVARAFELVLQNLRGGGHHHE